MNSAKTRVAVFIDGGNFYHKLKDINIKNTSRFGYRQLSNWLARDRILVYAGYYIGVVRAKPDDAKGQRLRAGQVGLFNFLRSPKQGFVIRQGYLRGAIYHFYSPRSTELTTKSCAHANWNQNSPFRNWKKSENENNLHRRNKILQIK